ncbi:MAG TPA: 2-dehydropantoate 2-reductase [Longimicrobium sp.]|nr:2-dehydropantoate 2-reductase [Longimicrobium sp.]
MRVAIFGSGGIGGYFGGRLAQAGTEVSFVARGAHLEAMRRNGLEVESVRGSFHLHPVHATDDPAEVGEVDLVVLAVKTWQLRDAATAIRPLLGPDTAVLTLQNGVEAPSVAAEIVGRERVIAGLVRIFSSVGAPGHIRHIGGPASITFAELDSVLSERVARLRDAFRAADVTVEIPDDIQVALWEKFLFVVAMGGLGALSRAPVGILRTVPETRRLLEEAMREIAAVGVARGIGLSGDVVERSMAFIDAQPAAGTSSLQRDVAAGRPSELDAWTGAVVRLGDEVGTPTPINRLVHHALLPLERRARGELSFAE